MTSCPSSLLFRNYYFFLFFFSLSFFEAIQFVLCDAKYDRLTKPARIALLHEGAGRRVDRAYVDITFDNTSRRLPYALDVVSLRRQVGVDKDMFFINKKHTPKSEVVSMLESAGFSRSNPYYIVQQGKVKKLALMSAVERLDLFKQIAGCDVYDSRRKESMKLYNDASKQQEQIAECHTQIDERLNQLEEEKEELSAYQELDKTRRALEYTLFNKDLVHSREALDRLDEQRSTETQTSDEMHGMLTDTTTKAREYEALIQRAEEDLLLRSEERAEAERARGLLRAEVAQSQLEVRDTQQRFDDAMKNRGDMQTEEKELVSSIAKENEKLDGESGLRATYVAENKTLEETRASHERCEDRIRYLQDIEGRAARFQNKKQRDQFLKTNIKELTSSLASATYVHHPLMD